MLLYIVWGEECFVKGSIFMTRTFYKIYEFILTRFLMDDGTLT